MPLVLLGLLVILGIVIYALVRYGQSDEEPRPMRERFPRVFDAAEELAERMKNGANYTIIDDDDEEDDDRSGGDSDSAEDDDNTIHFPDNAEVEKIKRNIH